MVRPRREGKAPVLLCATAFCLTAAAVYSLGYRHWNANRPRPTYTATALVVDGESNARVPFPCTDADSRRAVETANAKAEKEAEHRRAAWRRNLEEPYRNALEAVERAVQEHRESMARLDSFERQQRDAALLAKKTPSLIENPRWLELRKELSRLEQRRDQLLIDRTPLHPAVIEVDDEISGIQGQLAAVPPKIAAAPASEPTKETAPFLPAQNSGQSQKLAQAVERARLARDEAQRAEKAIEQKRQAGPQLVVQYAEAVQDPSPPDSSLQRLLWSSLMAGAFMTFGVGSVSAGSKIELPVTSAAEVENGLGLPILGAIPGDGPAADAEAIHRLKTVRRATLALGLFLMAGSPLLAIWGIAGI